MANLYLINPDGSRAENPCRLSDDVVGIFYCTTQEDQDLLAGLFPDASSGTGISREIPINSAIAIVRHYRVSNGYNWLHSSTGWALE